MPAKRKLALVLGVMLFVGGWGAVHYTDARQDALTGKNRSKAWQGSGTYWSARYMYLGGIISMTIGGMCVVFAKH